MPVSFFMKKLNLKVKLMWTSKGRWNLSVLVGIKKY